MNQNINDSYTMELDEGYYKRLLKADFFEKDGMIFIKDFVSNFDHNLKQCLEKGESKTRIEMYMNHVMMEFVSTFYKKQKGLAENIIKNWKKKLKDKFPNKKFTLELVDEGGGYVIYLYTKRKESIILKGPDHNISIRELV